MKKYERLKELIIRSIEEEDWQNEIISVYAYGSLPQGDFEEKYSDVDLWFVINECDVKKRIDIVRKLSNKFNELIFDFISDINQGEKNSEEFHGHEFGYYTKKEFLAYCKTYPTRVVYPIKKNVWKLVYGQELLKSTELLCGKQLLEYLQYDFENFVYEFMLTSYTSDVRTSIKFFLRAMKKAVWIITGIYLPYKSRVLQEADIILPHDELTIEVFERIRYVVKAKYLVSAKEYRDMYYSMIAVLDKYACEIRRVLTEQRINVISKRKRELITTWGNYAGNFSDLINEYIQIKDMRKRELIQFVKINYCTFSRCFEFMENSNCPPELFWVHKEMLPMKTCVLENNNSLLLKEMSYTWNDYYEIFDDILCGKFESMTKQQMSSYIERKFLPALYEIFEYYLCRFI